MPKSTGFHYTKEFKYEVVQLVCSSPERSIHQLAYELGISDQILRNWIKQAQIDRSEREGFSTEEREELRRLRKENRGLREEHEILDKSRGLLREGCQDLVSCYRLIEAEKATHSIPLLCRTLAVSRSGYYAWRNKPPSERTRFDAVLSEKIETIHRNSRATYGAPRIHAELAAIGQRTSAPGSSPWSPKIRRASSSPSPEADCRPQTRRRQPTGRFSRGRQRDGH